MAFSRALGVIGIVTVSWLAAVGCGDDDGKKIQGGEGGEGGEAPAGGKSSAGGSMSNGGGGKSSGGGGTSSAGDAGAGLGGAGGPPSVDGGAGGDGPVTPSAGAGGDGGAGGEPAATLTLCGNECEVAADCNIGVDFPGACDQETKRCYDPSKVRCQDNDDCVPASSSWSTNCTSDNDCADDDSERCIDVKGVGWCAPLPGEGCTFGEPTELPIFGVATATATVCASTLDRCRGGSCEFNCADPIFGGFCGAGNGDSCNAATGLCECADGPECEATGICGADKHCTECATDQDCIDKNALGLDKCFAGTCGCGSVSSCPDLTQAGNPVCE